MSLPPLLGTTEWLRGEGPASDVVMSSRVRLARNLAGFPFMARTRRELQEKVLGTCHAAIAAAGLAPNLLWIDVHRAAPRDRLLLMERHLISLQLSKGKKPGAPESTASTGEEPRAVAFSLPDERLSIMINEEDHLRIQVVHSGLDFGPAMARAMDADDRLESTLDFAYSPRFGYLTACPTNVGTGLRLSVMLHLPALRLTGNIEKVQRAAQDMSLAVRGFYGEGSEAVGDLYQLSNQTTLGKPESVLQHELEMEILPKVIDYERSARRTLATKRRHEHEDQCNRALGALLHARLMSTDEAMKLLSLVRLGVLTGAITGLQARAVNEAILAIQPAHLQHLAGQELDQDSRRHVRATLIRERLRPA